MKEYVSFENPVEIVFNTIKDIFFILNSEYKFQYINKSASDFFRTASSELIDASFWDVYPFQEAALLSDILIQASLQGEKISQQYYSLSHSQWFNATAYKWNEGLAVILSPANSESVRQDDLLQNVKVLSLVLDYIPHIAFMLNQKAQVVYLNKRWTEYTGTSVEQGMGIGWGERIHPTDFQKKMLLWDQNTEAGTAFKTKFRILSKRGEYRWHADSLVPLPTKEKKPSLWVGTATDIEDFIRVKRRQEFTNKALHVVLNSAPQITVVYNTLNQTFIYCNSAFNQILGFPLKELYTSGLQFFERNVHPDDLSLLLEHFGWVAEAGSREDRTIEVRIKDVKEVWHKLLLRSVILNNTTGGKIKFTLHYFTDISALKEIEDKLRESLHLATTITTTTPDLIMIYDIPSESIVYLNKSQLSDYGPEELKKMNKEERTELIYPDDRVAVLQFHDNFYTATDEEIREIEYRVKKKQSADEDEWVWLNERRMVFQRNEKGMVQQFIAVIQDITERKEAEIRKTEYEILNKLVEKKEEFISVASHELKTPITTIKASIQILKRLIQNHSDEHTLLVFVIKATQQVNKLMSLIGDLFDNTGFNAGKLHLNISRFNFSSLLEEIISSYEGQRVIQIEGIVDVEIEADEVRLGQVINNFLSNAIKYSPEETPVRIITSLSHGMLKVQIADQGKGIAPEKLEHLFARFYRVDENLTEVSGLGLGLYIASEIIKLHGGTYGVASELGRGSTFWFEIPVKVS